MKIALAQMNIIWENKDLNKQKCEKFIKEAKKSNVDYIIFPEMTLTGFTMNVGLMGERDFSTVQWFQGKAMEFDINIGFGQIERVNNKGLNNFYVVSNTGVILSKYCKIHPFSYANENMYYESGDSIKSYSMGEFLVTSFICYDLRFPEIFQIASKKSELITIVANWPESRRDHWITLLKARAIENQCYICGVNRVGLDAELSYSGDSMIIDPNGKVVTRLKNKEGLLIDDIDVGIVNSIRNNFNIKKDRKEYLYTKYFSFK